MTTAMLVAKERQLDWLLEQVLGGERTVAEQPDRAMRSSWLAAAVALFAICVCLGVVWLRALEGPSPAQQPAPVIPWIECHGAGGLDKVPADVTALRCFDFDDAACARLATFPKLEHLDLSGTDVNDKGYSVSLKITDAGVHALAPLTALRSLSLAGCEKLKGLELRVLEAMPRLDSLDLEHCGIEAPAVWRLARLPSLRSLSMSYCMNFHGSALAAVASLPGLRKLDLRGCVTLSAKDAMVLANLKQLRHLDLRDCQGRFRGQTLQVDEPGVPADPGSATFIDTNDDGIPDARVLPPVQDGIGITDDVVAALAALPLETFLLGGSESLTNAIGKPIGKMTTLRSLDLSNLPKTTGIHLPCVPAGVESLALDDNPQWIAPMLKVVPPLPGLRELGLSGLPTMREEDLAFVLRGKSLRVLRLSGATPQGKDGATAAFLTNGAPLGAGAGALVASQRELQRLELRNVRTLEPAFLAELAALQHLIEIDLTSSGAGAPGTMRELGRCRALRSLKLMWCKNLTIEGLRELAGCPLAQLDVYGTNLDAAAVKEVARAWPGCVVTLPKGQRWRAE